MIPVEVVLSERTQDEIITDFVYQVHLFGFVVFRRVFHNNVVPSAPKKCGFDVFEDLRQEVEDYD